MRSQERLCLDALCALGPAPPAPACSKAQPPSGSGGSGGMSVAQMVEAAEDVWYEITYACSPELSLPHHMHACPSFSYPFICVQPLTVLDSLFACMLWLPVTHLHAFSGFPLLVICMQPLIVFDSSYTCMPIQSSTQYGNSLSWGGYQHPSPASACAHAHACVVAIQCKIFIETY